MALDEAPAKPAKLRIATFQADVTPPLGDGVGIGFMRKIVSIEHRVLAKGVVLRDEGGTYVLCALDSGDLCNDSHDLFRNAIGKAVGTPPSRVAVQSLHLHTAPVFDANARRLLYRDDQAALARGLEFVEEAAGRVAASVRQALDGLRPVTHVGTGMAKVERAASSRRLIQKDGSILTRMSSTKDAKLQAAPEGLIDPRVRTIAFFNKDQPLVYLHYYATHPQSFYGDGRISYDVPGIARQRLEKETGVPQVYFTGCGGNIAFGKYNNGTRAARSQLATRLHDGMRRSLKSVARQPVTKIDWQTRELAFPLRKDAAFSAETARNVVNDADASFSKRLKHAMNLAWIERTKAGRPVECICLSIGSVRLIHLPGEQFVEYQLFAQKVRPELFVAVAAYGDCAMWYVGPDSIYTDRGGYEQTWSFGGPVEKPLKQILTGFVAGKP